jgi:branched-chain amino acid transport system substrate-binding protein
MSGFVIKAATFAVGLSLALASLTLSAGVTDTEIVIGGNTPLSGPAAIWGATSTDAAQIRIDEANEAGGIHGRRIRMIVEDNQYQVPLAVRATNKLIRRDEVLAVFGALGTPQVLAIKDRMFQAGVPLLFPFTAARAVNGEFEPLKITYGSTYYDQVQAAIEHFTTERGRENVCVMYQDSDYGAEVRRAAEDKLAAMGKELVSVVSHKPTATEFVGAMTGFKSAGCDLIIMGTIIRDTIVGYATARRLGLDADLVTTAAGIDNFVAAAEGGATEGLYGFGMIAPVYRDNLPETAESFFDTYRKRHGSDPGVAAMLGYVWADILVQALENAGRDLTVDSLMGGFHQIKDYQDPFGNPPFSFAEGDHHGSEEMVFLEVRDGRWIPVESN